MLETSILAKNLIKSYFEEVGDEDTPILDKFDKLIAKYVKNCDVALTNINAYLNLMWDKGLNEKYIREFIEELTKYIDESTASKINKGLKFTESLEESNISLKESNYDLINDDLLAMCKGSTKQLIYAIDDYQSNYSDKSLKELKRRIEEVKDFCDKILYQINKR